jgi:hypothetical protein
MKPPSRSQLFEISTVNSDFEIANMAEMSYGVRFTP